MAAEKVDEEIARESSAQEDAQPSCLFFLIKDAPVKLQSCTMDSNCNCNKLHWFIQNDRGSFMIVVVVVTDQTAT
jgi:hypothetical protein